MVELAKSEERALFNMTANIKEEEMDTSATEPMQTEQDVMSIEIPANAR